jgi:hypothetical protein
MSVIIAVDFDGILCENRFPEIGPQHDEMVSFIREVIDKGHEVVLWTSRVGEELTAAVDWCEVRGIHFCAVNENAPSNIAKYKAKYPSGTRKVYADVYIDDHNPNFVVVQDVFSTGTAVDITIKNVRRILEWNEEN